MGEKMASNARSGSGTDFPEPERTFATLADGRMSYLEWPGDGPLLHFAHANGFNAETYRSLLGPLAGAFRIRASDARGHGFSTLSATEGSARNWTIFRDDLLHVLENWGSEKAILAGHSMGATISVMAAAIRPEIARALVLIEPVFVPALPWMLGRMMATLGLGRSMPNLADRAMRRRDVFHSREAAFQAYVGRGAFKSWPDIAVRDYVQGGTIETGRHLEVRLACHPKWEAENFRQTPLLIPRLGARIRCPVVILHGAGPGSTCRDADARLFAHKHGNTRIVKIATASHFLPMEYPERVREEIRGL